MHKKITIKIKFGDKRQRGQIRTVVLHVERGHQRGHRNQTLDAFTRRDGLRHRTQSIYEAILLFIG